MPQPTPETASSADEELPRPPSPRPSLREIAIEDLLGVDGQIVIRHGAERYLLRLTRQNRLLLTK